MQRGGNSILFSETQISSAVTDVTLQPTLCIVIDTEAEFDWYGGYRRDLTETHSIREQYRAQEIYARFGARPTYVMDYAVASKDEPAALMQALFKAGDCDLGSHLHPWITPPFDEPLTVENSYHCNLNSAIERAKLDRLTQAVTEVRGSAPKVFKAGRNGLGAQTVSLLEASGYDVDCSVVPHADYSLDGGPDFRGISEQPSWFGEIRRLLEVPETQGYLGLMRGMPGLWDAILERKTLRNTGFRGLLSRVNLINVAMLTPEGVPERELVELLTTQINDGKKVMTLTYHSSSLLPGCTTYVGSAVERDAFLQRIELVLKIATEDLGMRIMPVHALYQELADKA